MKPSPNEFNEWEVQLVQIVSRRLGINHAAVAKLIDEQAELVLRAWRNMDSPDATAAKMITASNLLH